MKNVLVLEDSKCSNSRPRVNFSVSQLDYGSSFIDDMVKLAYLLFNIQNLYLESIFWIYI